MLFIYILLSEYNIYCIYWQLPLTLLFSSREVPKPFIAIAAPPNYAILFVKMLFYRQDLLRYDVILSLSVTLVSLLDKFPINSCYA